MQEPASDDLEILAAAVAHELRTPLAALSGEVDVALRRDRSPADYRAALVRIAAAVAELVYAEQSRAAEADVRRLLESRSALMANPRTRSGLQKVAAAWKQCVVVRDEVIGLILEGSLTEGVALDEQQGAARFDAVRKAIGELKMSFEADAARQVAEQRARASRAVTRLSLMVVGTVLATANAKQVLV